MKIRLCEVRELVRRILRESKCPFCGEDGAYIGFSDVECANRHCKKFSPKQAAPAQSYPKTPDQLGKSLEQALPWPDAEIKSGWEEEPDPNNGDAAEGIWVVSIKHKDLQRALDFIAAEGFRHRVDDRDGFRMVSSKTPWGIWITDLGDGFIFEIGR